VGYLLASPAASCKLALDEPVDPSISILLTIIRLTFLSENQVTIGLFFTMLALLCIGLKLS
jgi:hypothetical protein